MIWILCLPHRSEVLLLCPLDLLVRQKVRILLKHILLPIKEVILFLKHWARVIEIVHIFDIITHILIGSSASHACRRNITSICLNALILKKVLKVSIVVACIRCESGGHLDYPRAIERRLTVIRRKPRLLLKIHIVHN